MKYIAALALLLLVSCAASTDGETEIETKLKKEKIFAVALNEYSAVRFQPQLNSSRIDYLNKGDNVEIIGHSAEQSKIGGVREYWYKIALPSGITGWTFGSNIKILKEGDDFSIEDYRQQVTAQKLERTIKQLKGKWWSVTQSGNFTSHMLMLYPDGTYKSSRGSFRKEGSFTLDMDKKELSFSEGTSFGDKLNFFTRGQELVLEIETEDQTYRFKKIASETDKETEERLEEYQIEDLEESSESTESSET